MEFIKLTDSTAHTYNKSVLWKLGERQVLLSKINPRLCSSDVLHCYENREIALILNQGAYYPPRMFQILSGPIVVKDWGKIGTFWQEPIRELPLPSWYVDKNQLKKVLVQFSILCALSVIAVFETKYPNDNRPRKAIEAAQDYLNGSRNAAAAYTAADAATAAADAADAAAYAARAAAAAAYTAADAATAAADAADAAAAAADAAAAAAAAYAARAAAAYAARAAAAAAAAYAARAAAAAAAAYAARAAADAATAAADAAYAARAAAAAAAAAYTAADADAINFPELAQKAVEMVETQNVGY